MAVGRFITESVEIKINAEHVEPTITCRYCLPLFLSISSWFSLINICWLAKYLYFGVCIIRLDDCITLIKICLYFFIIDYFLK